MVFKSDAREVRARILKLKFEDSFESNPRCDYEALRVGHGDDASSRRMSMWPFQKPHIESPSRLACLIKSGPFSQELPKIMKGLLGILWRMLKLDLCGVLCRPSQHGSLGLVEVSQIGGCFYGVLGKPHM